MLRTITAWLVFFGGFGIEMGIDRFLRMRNGDVTSGGIPEPVWFAIQIGLAVGATFLAWQGTRTLQATWKRLAVVLVELVLGFVIYAFACLWYIVASGIDSL